MIVISEHIEYSIYLYPLTKDQHKALKEARDDLWNLCGMEASLSREEFYSGIFESEADAEELRSFLIDLLEDL